MNILNKKPIRSSDTASVSPGSMYEEVPLITGNQTFSSVTEKICSIVENDPPKMWYVLFGISLSLLLMLVGSVGYLIWEGTGIWGLNNPVGWGWAIVNFVFWVGIGHAGTLISAVLYLFRQKWRTSINRFAEAMTIFAVICALLFPTIHVGRIWVLYWFFPIPNQMEMWPNFRSPLLWDVFAVSIYFTVSLLFWYVGLVPDLATLRDRAKTKARRVLFGILSLGWRGGNRHWRHYELGYLILAGLSTPLVLSVHSVVSTDFATSIIPGWHTTIFPPYFVAGAIFSGFAMVMTLAIIARKAFGMEDFITIGHLEKMAKIIMVTGLMVGYAYSMEFFIAWYSGNSIEQESFWWRAFGTYAPEYWIMVICNTVIPLLFLIKKIRTHIVALFVISIFVNIGMWMERFVIIIGSVAHDFLPNAWGFFAPTMFEFAIMFGAFCLFFFLFLLFAKHLPSVSMTEMKEHVHHRSHS